MAQHDAERLRRVAEIGQRHATAEASGTLEEIMATLAPDPVYDGVAQEYDIWLRVDGAREHHRVVGILTPNEDGTLLTGERVFADDLYVRRLVGDEIFGELTPLEPAG